MEPDLRAALADMPPLRWWAYRLPPVLERRFASETDAARNRLIRLWVGIDLAFFWLAIPLDHLSVPDVWRLDLLLKLCVITPVSLSALRILGAVRPPRLVALAGIVPLGVGASCVQVMFAASAAFDLTHSTLVLTMTIVWPVVLVPNRLRDTLLFAGTTLLLGDAINVGVTLGRQVPVSIPDIAIACHVIIVLSVLGRFVAERESRGSFLLGLRLQVRAEELARANDKLLEMSNTDPLTGLSNRRFFDNALAQAWQAAIAGDRAIAVMMVDIDHFKLFNDAAGHLEGDRCLTIVARAVADHVRQGLDLAARFGGEEFVVLMPRTEHVEAHEVAERVRAAIAALQVFHPGRVGDGFVSVSIGVAAMLPGTQAAEPAELIAAADAALYAAKRAGRDRVVSANRDAAKVAA
jgi:diguanylate cyclase (GGDEF)-like protein